MRLQPVTGIREPLKRRKDSMAQDVSHIRSFFEGIRDERGTHQNTATRIGTALLMLLEYLATIDYPYLRKDIDDAAAGHITFLKGITAQLQSLFADLAFTGVLKSEGARGGFTDGKGIYMDAAGGLMEADGLNVRGFMRVMELIINRLQLMESDYSFTEGGTVEHVDITQNGQRMVWRMHKQHDNDTTPFYLGDILYAKVNDLLSHGTYYTCWVRVESVDTTANTLTVVPYIGHRNDNTAVVPGGTNFTPKGYPITTDYTAALVQELALYPDGYDMQMNVTRHGNVADSADPAVLATQRGRQQSWVLSTTDKRLSFFWNVDAPIIRDDNYALCLGILPDLANLPTTRDRSMPSLYVNTVFYDNQHRANYPDAIVKTDRGQWTATPTTVYTGPTGARTPDGTLSDSIALALGWTGDAELSFTEGQTISEPYHCNHITRNTWLSYRLKPSFSRYSDADLYQKILQEYKNDLEISRAWNNGKLWECLVDATIEEPKFGCQEWEVVSGNTVFYGELFTSNGQTFRNGNIDTILTIYVWWGDEDITDAVLNSQDTTISWIRKTGYNSETQEFEQQSEDLSWVATSAGRNKIRLVRGDMGSGWMITYRRALIHCTVSFTSSQGQTVQAPADLIL